MDPIHQAVSVWPWGSREACGFEPGDVNNLMEDSEMGIGASVLRSGRGSRVVDHRTLV